ncbi:MAG: hypothetical protein KKF68_00820 [Nanoarchaeota archaeon]|nr:hypothetical protein [Nanoarchaeota archaeon]
MGLFGFKKKEKVIDLSEKYKKQQEKTAKTKSGLQQEGSSTSAPLPGFNIFNNPASGFGSQQTSDSEEYLDASESANERKRKLAKRLFDMTNKLEDISNQIYHLQQRIEVIEKKLDVNRF